MWSSHEAVSLAECIASNGLPTSTPSMSIWPVRMLPRVEPPATSLWLMKYWQGEPAALKVKFGPSYLDEGDVLIIVPEDEGKINVAWFLYEMIVLSIPIHHTHKDGECNAEMMKILKEHSDQNFNDEDSAVANDNKIDPRWSDLKNLLNNN